MGFRPAVCAVALNAAFHPIVFIVIHFFAERAIGNGIEPHPGTIGTHGSCADDFSILGGQGGVGFSQDE
jgi:hypothetical protein